MKVNKALVYISAFNLSTLCTSNALQKPVIKFDFEITSHKSNNSYVDQYDNSRIELFSTIANIGLITNSLGYISN